MLRCGACQGRDADHRSGGPRYLSLHAGIAAARVYGPNQQGHGARHCKGLTRIVFGGFNEGQPSLKRTDLQFYG
jgi:hypothetical protein